MACNYYARKQLVYRSSFILTVNRYANREAAKHADRRADMRGGKNDMPLCIAQLIEGIHDDDISQKLNDDIYYAI